MPTPQNGLPESSYADHADTCGCGCGVIVRPGARFLRGHHNRLPDARQRLAHAAAHQVNHTPDADSWTVLLCGTARSWYDERLPDTPLIRLYRYCFEDAWNHREVCFRRKLGRECEGCAEDWQWAFDTAQWGIMAFQTMCQHLGLDGDRARTVFLSTA